MADARQRAAWQHTASVLALLANCHRDPKKTRAFKPADFDPFARRGGDAKVGVDVLKDVFIDRKVPKEGRT
jgi:hypothetical protein